MFLLKLSLGQIPGFAQFVMRCAHQDICICICIYMLCLFSGCLLNIKKPQHPILQDTSRKGRCKWSLSWFGRCSFSSEDAAASPKFHHHWLPSPLGWPLRIACDSKGASPGGDPSQPALEECHCFLHPARD